MTLSEGDAIKVMVRVRPPLKGDPGACLQAYADHNRIVMNSTPEKIYTFDQVADADVAQVRSLASSSYHI